MPFSMTAFARHALEVHEPPGGALTWELRTVNHRFFEAVIRLPEGCRELEGELRDRARGRLARGRLEANLRLEGAAGAKALAIDPDALQALLDAMHSLQSLQRQLNVPTVLDVLRWPGILTEPQRNNAALIDAARSSFDAALDSLIEQRGREGAALQRVLSERLEQIAALTLALRREAADIPAQLQTKLSARLAELGSGVEPQRLAQEVALLAQRADTAEELDRLDAHRVEFQRALTLDTPIGRQLDFLAQELNREANTLASKAGSSAMAQLGIELKVLIEQMREQVQNVE